MKVCGRLISKQLASTRDGSVEFYRIVVAVEKGHEAELVKISVFDNAVSEMIQTTPLQAGVSVDTYQNVGGYRNALKVELVDLISCSVCFNFTVDDGADAQKPCETCSKKVTLERIQGEWVLKSKRDYLSSSQHDQLQIEEPAKRVLFEQAGNLLGYVAFSNAPFYEELSHLMVGGTVELVGWRDDERHTKFVKVTATVPVKEQLSCDICTKSFKNKGSLRKHLSTYH